VDCYSPEQVLMPTRFKFRTVPLDGSVLRIFEDHEEVFNPDFGESAIGCVASIDSGKIANLSIFVDVDSKISYLSKTTYL
jgi:hypothetical protein